MILTGSAIKTGVETGEIVISPFNAAQLNPNSYNYRLGRHLRFREDSGELVSVELPEAGFVLEPHRTYLGHTYETLGSDKYAMSLIGRSSTGRLGLFLQVSADLGHTGSKHKWTLEIVAAKKIIVYPGIVIGQISFWLNEGSVSHYRDGYTRYSVPQVSKFEEIHDTHW
jgi:dCTP deaminase